MHHNNSRSAIIMAILVFFSFAGKSQMVLHNTSLLMGEDRHFPIEYAHLAKESVPENNLWTNKNVLNLSVGYYIINGKINYDRYLFNWKKSTIWFSVGTGVHLVFYPFYTTGSLKLLTGKKNNHFELDVGGTALFMFSYYEDEDEPDLWQTLYLPHINFGYRYQKPGGKIVLRTGLGFPEFAYLGIGLAFSD